MKKKFTNRSRTRKGILKFKPNRDYVAEATEYFLNHGGQITFLDYEKKSEYTIYVDSVSVSSEVDEFLMG